MIRKISSTDLDPVLNFMRVNMLPYYLARGEKWNGSALRNYFSSKSGLVLRRDGQLVACSFYEFNEDNLQIHTLQLEAKFQNRLIGAKFFRWYLALANDMKLKAITCSVYESNPAYRMYLKMGFRVVGKNNDVIQLEMNLAKSLIVK